MKPQNTRDENCTHSTINGRKNVRLSQDKAYCIYNAVTLPHILYIVYSGVAATQHIVGLTIFGRISLYNRIGRNFYGFI